MKKIFKIFVFFMLFGIFVGKSNRTVFAEEPVIIVIDPGHGGENLGAEYEQYTEKNMTMVAAKAMKEELEKYENVVVYLTLETDGDMSIKDRALFAKEKNADFLFCLHFNMSISHELFGAEVWVPAFGDFYSKGYRFAEIEMNLLTDTGLYSRGIKTRLNDRGDNYYGILRYCSNNGIPSVLIEHCHLDQANDQPYYQQGEEQLKEFGRLDATAVAKYFRLKSEKLGVDYSDYPVSEIASPEEAVKPDKTEPDVCEIEVLDLNKETGEVTVRMRAEDYDSYILYYNYSFDGGNTYSPLEKWERPVWNKSEPEMTFTVTIPLNQKIELRTNAYNGFDVWTESNIRSIPAIPSAEEAEKEALLTDETSDALKEEYQEIIYEDPLETGEEQASAGKTSAALVIILVSLLLLMMICITLAMVKMILTVKKSNTKKR